MTEPEWAKPTIENGWLEMLDGSGCDLGAIKTVRYEDARTWMLPEVGAMHPRVMIETNGWARSPLVFACPDSDIAREVAREISAAIRAHRAGK